MREIRAMSPGKLGHGCNADEIAKAMTRDPHFIAVDAGSTDMGAFHLGSGTPFFHPISIKQDLAPLLQAACSQKIPLIIGTAVTAGTNALLERALEIVREVAREQNLSFRMATVRAEQDRAFLKGRLHQQPIEALGARAPLTDADIDGAAAVVAQMGVEPIIKALDTGARVVVAGRSCDDALFAAIPVRDGFDQGLAMHMGKILECGSMACVPGDLHGSLVGYLREDHFILDPPDERRVCTVHSVASHTLYERSNPYLQPGPGGVNDLRETRFEQVDARRVKVSGSRWIRDCVYKVKLEGVRFAGYRTICVAGIRDPILIGQLDQALGEAETRTAERFGPDRRKYQMVFRQYGRDAVMGALEPERDGIPHEIGLMIEVIAETQDLADAVCMYVRGTLQHAYYPGIVATAGNLAYPFSPFTVPCGPVYHFHVDHLLPLNDPCECFPVEVEEVGRVVTAVGG
ncbi:MAG: acyclic terpene utilization AtuA family protein [Armatimonadetes bacterium]|nr:acyclic terpene utilization AtuA family protein [Armatimonadota bacterium]